MNTIHPKKRTKNDSANKVWLIEGNSAYFDHIKCFREVGECYWNQQNCKFAQNDIAYIYIKKEGCFLFKTIVVETNVRDKNPQKYRKEKYGNFEKCIKLKLIKEYDGDKKLLHKDILEKYGFKPGCLQKHTFNKKRLIEYIENCFNENLTDEFTKNYNNNDKFREGVMKKVLVSIYERSNDARRNFLGQHSKPYKCEVCGMDFESVYGKRGEGFIHVHHVNQLSKRGPGETQYKDLAMLCPNCHAMLHRGELISPDELKEIMQKNKQ